MIRIGIDVGGTNTDAVVMDGAEVLAGVKVADDAGCAEGRRRCARQRAASVSHGSATKWMR